MGWQFLSFEFTKCNQLFVNEAVVIVVFSYDNYKLFHSLDHVNRVHCRQNIYFYHFINNL